MRWFDGARYLGRGSVLTVRGMTPGRRSLRLVTFADGRRGVFTVPVQVRRVTPAFTLLRLAAGRRSLTLTAATTVPGLLIVSGHRYAVGPDPRVIVLPLVRGHGRLRLGLQLRTFTGTLRVVKSLTRR
jgi:hypothetical protein